MKSIIFATASRYLLPLLLLFSFFVLFRGHNDPGGGFVGGLVAAAAFSLYALANSSREAREILGIQPGKLISIGLFISLTSALFSWFTGSSFMTSIWSEIHFPVAGKLSTPLMFDIGVYLVVIGVTLVIIFTLAEER
jgi:multicomponent Na+:H+ antiporter subunit B